MNERDQNESRNQNENGTVCFGFIIWIKEEDVCLCVIPSRLFLSVRLDHKE